MSSASENGQSARRLPPQVLEQICRELLVPPEHILAKRVGCGTVAALASTARLFYEPALNALWHTIPDIAVLFYTLSEDAYKKRRPKERNRWPKGYLQFSFNGIPEASQLERFLAYARRVRRVDGNGTLPTRVANHSALPSAYDTLAKLLHARRNKLSQDISRRRYLMTLGRFATGICAETTAVYPGLDISRMSTSG